jgi:hypothetical protein
MCHGSVTTDINLDGQFGLSDVWVNHVTARNDGVQIANSPTRTVVDGWGTNDRDPSAGGQWNGKSYEGLQVPNTTNNIKYVYRNDGWV